jgi:dihydrofolate reductase
MIAAVCPSGQESMRKLKIVEHMSLDGVIQVGDGAGEDDHFDLGDWTAPYRSPAGLQKVLGAYGERFDLLLGRRTYDAWSGYWPGAPKSPMADRLNAATKYVATHRPDSLQWGPAEGIGPDLAHAVRSIKATDGDDLILSGSASLIATLLAHGLVDEVLLIVYPVLLGKGKRFFTDGTPPRVLELDSSETLPSGVTLNAYKIIGPLAKEYVPSHCTAAVR